MKLRKDLCRAISAQARPALRGACAITAAAVAIWMSRGLALAAAEEATLQGEVVDLACYIPRGDKGKGEAHRECAEMCAQGGAPLGLLLEGGELVLLVEDHEKPSPYGQVKKLAGQTAEVKGERFSRGGIAAIAVHGASAKE
jgi:hypothetical protein